MAHLCSAYFENVCSVLQKIHQKQAPTNMGLYLEYLNGPTVEALKAESPKISCPNGHEISVFLRVCNIFCMREAVYTSYGFRMRAGSAGP